MAVLKVRVTLDHTHLLSIMRRLSGQLVHQPAFSATTTTTSGQKQRQRQLFRPLRKFKWSLDVHCKIDEATGCRVEINSSLYHSLELWVVLVKIQEVPGRAGGRPMGPTNVFVMAGTRVVDRSFAWLLRNRYLLYVIYAMCAYIVAKLPHALAGQGRQFNHLSWRGTL